MQYEYAGIWESLSAWWHGKADEPNEELHGSQLYRFARHPILLGHANGKEVFAMLEWFVIYLENTTKTPDPRVTRSEVFGKPISAPQGFVPVKIGTHFSRNEDEEDFYD